MPPPHYRMFTQKFRSYLRLNYGKIGSSLAQIAMEEAIFTPSGPQLWYNRCYMDKANLPIGVFDSGVGGLTVASEIIKVLPNENLIYVGDTARVPYGTRDPKTIELFANELLQFLLKQNVKAIVVACNTITATCINEIVSAAQGIKVIDVISPTVEEALDNFSGTLGVIGTRATINSKAYENRIASRNPSIKVVSKACPLFVPLVEECLIDSPATTIIAKDYLSDVSVDRLILGCTHYPLLRKTIEEVLPNVSIVDSAKPTANALKKYLQENDILNNSANPSYRFIVTDSTTHSQEVADLIFEGKMPGKLEKVELINY